MRKIKPFLNIFLILLLFIVLHNSVINIISNMMSYMRENNKEELIIKSYEQKIENLEKTIFDYESSIKKLSIYDGSVYILGKIGIRNVYDFYNYLIISTDSKVGAGSAVLNEDGLIGIVKNSNMDTAKVDLLTGNVNVSIKVGDAFGIINSYDKKKNQLIVHNVNNYKNVNVGDEVVTSGLQEIDADLKIGVVEEIDKDSIEQIIYVKPYVNFDSLNYVMVVNK